MSLLVSQVSQVSQVSHGGWKEAHVTLFPLWLTSTERGGAISGGYSPQTGLALARGFLGCFAPYLPLVVIVWGITYQSNTLLPAQFF